MKNKMKTLPKIHVACSDYYTIPVMCHVLITKEHIVASDYNILVVHKTENIFDNEFIKNMPDRFLINRKHWAEMCKKHFAIKYENNLINVIRDNYTDIYPIFLESIIGDYPDYKKVIPQKKDLKKIKTIAINPMLLKRLYDSMAYRGDYPAFILKFQDECHSILVKMNNDDLGQIGIIMPVMINEKNN